MYLAADDTLRVLIGKIYAGLGGLALEECRGMRNDPTVFLTWESKDVSV